MWRRKAGTGATAAAVLSTLVPGSGHASHLHTLYTFTGDNGSQPAGGFTDLGGLLYGTMMSGGGYIFSVTTSGSFNILENFGIGHFTQADGPDFAPLHVGDSFYVVTTGYTERSAGTVSRVPIHGGGGKCFITSLAAATGKRPREGS